MSVFIDLNTFNNDKRLKDLVIPSCLFIKPQEYEKQYFKFDLNNDLIIDDKLYNKLLDKASIQKKLSKLTKKKKEIVNKKKTRSKKK